MQTGAHHRSPLREHPLDGRALPPLPRLGEAASPWTPSGIRRRHPTRQCHREERLQNRLVSAVSALRTRRLWLWRSRRRLPPRLPPAWRWAGWHSLLSHWFLQRMPEACMLFASEIHTYTSALIQRQTILQVAPVTIRESLLSSKRRQARFYL